MRYLNSSHIIYLPLLLPGFLAKDGFFRLVNGAQCLLILEGRTAAPSLSLHFGQQPTSGHDVVCHLFLEEYNEEKDAAAAGLTTSLSPLRPQIVLRCTMQRFSCVTNGIDGQHQRRVVVVATVRPWNSFSHERERGDRSAVGDIWLRSELLLLLGRGGGGGTRGRS